jgi:hypothetical protein
MDRHSQTINPFLIRFHTVAPESPTITSTQITSPHPIRRLVIEDNIKFFLAAEFRGIYGMVDIAWLADTKRARDKEKTSSNAQEAEMERNRRKCAAFSRALDVPLSLCPDLAKGKE